MAKKLGTLWLNIETISLINAKEKAATSSVGTYYTAQGVPCTAFAQTYGPSHEKAGQMVRNTKGTHICLHVRAKKDAGGEKVLTAWLNPDTFNDIISGKLESTQPVGFAYPEGSDKPMTMFLATKRETGEVIRAKKDEKLVGFNLREGQRQEEQKALLIAG